MGHGGNFSGRGGQVMDVMVVDKYEGHNGGYSGFRGTVATWEVTCNCNWS